MPNQFPHFALPFRYVNGVPVTNEQDGLGDIAACVEAVCLVIIGELDDLPQFGIGDPTFDQEPLNVRALQSQIATWEPRANMLLEAAPNQFEAAIVNANILVGPQ